MNSSWMGKNWIDIPWKYIGTWKLWDLNKSWIYREKMGLEWYCY